MKVVFGLKAHSGWAALVVVGNQNSEIEIIDRRRLELVDDGQLWAKQPYHTAENLNSAEAAKVVKSGIHMAQRCALVEMRAALRRTRANGFQVAGCAVLVGDPMPEWGVDQILAVHFRMHKAEGVLFRDVLVRAGQKCGLGTVQIPEKALDQQAKATLGTQMPTIVKRIAALGKSVGPPWGKDQKDATLAALIALNNL
jgi:hypothetical protein